MKRALDMSVAEAVRRGLTSACKSLPPFLFYDERGSALFDAISRLPEYYPTRTERGILEQHGAAIARSLAGSGQGPLGIFELGAGSAVKTELLLRALLAQVVPSGALTYFPGDVSSSPVDQACARMARELPALRVRPVIGTHAEALGRVARWQGATAVLFLGSSIGNYQDSEAAELLASVRRAMGSRGALLVGLDHVKPLDTLLPAYNDGAGVTAAFNRNVLARINDELGADFRLDSFTHVALWNEAASAVEMHLESQVHQTVRIGALGLTVNFERGERIHTESSHKYTHERVAALLRAAGLLETARFEDERGWFSLRVARATR